MLMTHPLLLHPAADPLDATLAKIRSVPPAAGLNTSVTGEHATLLLPNPAPNWDDALMVPELIGILRIMGSAGKNPGNPWPHT
jgi:hypothetical protein